MESRPRAAHQNVKKGIALSDELIVEEVGTFRAKEAATLDAIHGAFVPAALEGEPRAAEIVLKARSAYRELTDLDLQREANDSGPAIVINTGLPPEVQAQSVEEESADELVAGK